MTLNYIYHNSLHKNGYMVIYYVAFLYYYTHRLCEQGGMWERLVFYGY